MLEKVLQKEKILTAKSVNFTHFPKAEAKEQDRKYTNSLIEPRVLLSFFLFLVVLCLSAEIARTMKTRKQNHISRSLEPDITIDDESYRICSVTVASVVTIVAAAAVTAKTPDQVLGGEMKCNLQL